MSSESSEGVYEEKAIPHADGALPETSPVTCRLLIITAAVLWSTSGLFTRLFDLPGLNEPLLTPLQRAWGRALFAGLVFLPLLRPHHLSFTPVMGWTALSFAAMNATFISAMTLGTSASAILLQYTSPLWIAVASVLWLKQPMTRRDVIALLVGMVGIGVIIAGGWEAEKREAVLLALASGFFLAGVILGLRAQRNVSAVWVTAVNHLTAAGVLIPFILYDATPTLSQFGVLFLYGTLQMGLPYVLMAQGMRGIGPQEAATLMLLEPMLNPIWAYLIDPVREKPTSWVLIGGACIIGALAYRYWPTGEKHGTGEERQT